jgi:hypothetical protein
MKTIYVLGVLRSYEDGTLAALAANVNGEYILKSVSINLIEDINDIYALIGEEVNVDMSLIDYFHERNGEHKYSNHVAKQFAILKNS